MGSVGIDCPSCGKPGSLVMGGLILEKRNPDTGRMESVEVCGECVGKMGHKGWTAVGAGHPRI